MKRVLITGGSGSLGRSFIKEYYDKYEFFSISRGEMLQSSLHDEFPNVKNFVGCITDTCFIHSVYEKVKPDIVIHAAAMKHIELVEQQPIQGCLINIVGSMGIINVSRTHNTPITIGISTDKACAAAGIYGVTKMMMEKCFMEANSDDVKFASCRFANIANSSSSIIPRWKKMKENNDTIKVTDKRMNRMFFSLSEAAKFIHRTIDECESGGGFVGVNTAMKSASIYKLAKEISNNIEIIGKRTNVEKFDEDLISEIELPYTSIVDEGYVKIFNHKNENVMNTLKESYGSHNAKPMSDGEIKQLIRG